MKSRPQIPQTANARFKPLDATAPQKSLKAQNHPVLWAVVAVDAGLLLVISLLPLIGSFSGLPAVALARTLIAPVVPVVVLLLNALLPASVKAILVFWRFKDVLPAHRAFSEHATNDPRIDLNKLKKNVGAFPDRPQEQNIKWYGLFKKVENDVSVQHVHRQFLLLRDLAALSLILLSIVGLACLLGVLPARDAQYAALLFLVQYLVAAIGARLQGNGFVTTVLALHSVKRRV